MILNLSALKAAIRTRSPRLFLRLIDVRDRFMPHRGEPELRLLPVLCSPDEAAYDIGANIGAYTFRMLERQSAARVVAFEPNTAMVSLLRDRFARPIAAGRLRIESCALSDADGEIVLFVPENTGLASVESPVTAASAQEDAPKALTVPRVTLDRFDEGPVGFLKIDVEGHESAVIAGGLDLIRRHRPNILVEAEERHHPGALATVKGLLEPLGYRGYYILDGRLHDLDGFDPDRLQNRAALNDKGTSRLKGLTYVNNFLFVARKGMAERLRTTLAGGR